MKSARNSVGIFRIPVFGKSSFYHAEIKVCTKPCTVKSLSEALVLESTNPQYDKRLFIDLPVLYMKRTRSEHVVYIIDFLFLF